MSKEVAAFPVVGGPVAEAYSLELHYTREARRCFGARYPLVYCQFICTKSAGSLSHVVVASHALMLM